MDKITNMVEWFKSITMENVIDVLISVIIIILFTMISSGIAHLIVKIFNIKEKDKSKIKKNAFYKPIKWFMIITGIYIALMILKLPDNVTSFIVKLYKSGIILLIAKGIANFFNSDSIVFERLQQKTSYSGDETLSNFISKIIKTVIYIIAGYMVISEWGYNLGGLAAGIGLSGVVVALAAQDIAKNLFGGFAIITDKPFIVGDWIETKTYSGAVEDITFRSTRIRSADHTLITIQNSAISNEPIINWSRMDKKRYSFTLTLPLETSKEAVERIMNKIRFILQSNKKIIEGSLEIHFDKIEKDGIVLLLYMNTEQIAFIDYQIFKEEINLEILNVLESERVGLGYEAGNICIKETNKITD